ncbi:UDP-N-acetylmuramate--L-alanine ligase [Vulgatibacter incomptus]|uniref:UDP-N-acetylmuramate--L-alanine ligase n=1 Tax=Vulgatibacter incomptus TaxID=1391653 RepID=A0A0K1PED7_9BACT|nr:UDP-N-acetylmuramate--L-alanine ligase [Vulgatibacter incomptus]AKU91862.1 UDP-N-acetylmuramate--alanine ligase [Vulgatibacter incomptus]
MFRGRRPTIHFVGIGGIGMSGIAEVLVNLGYPVTGSDLKEGDTTRRLEGLGARIAVGHRAENVGKADVVVISSAVRQQNPEVVEARRRAIPVIPRAEMLAELMRLKVGIAVAGSHGKTTTTSMIAHLLAAGGLDPTAVVGGKLNNLGSNAKLGNGEYMVVEADESDGSFLRFSPAIAVVTNVDPEHLDHYGDFDTLQRAFVDFVNKVPFYGVAVMCADHPVVQAMLPSVDRRCVTYGLSPQADYRAEAIETNAFEVKFVATRGGEPLGAFRLPMIGLHNVQNALAAIAVADDVGLPMDKVRDAFETFSGVQRRFTIRGEAAGVTVVDDYGHHPAEIKATLDGARRAFPKRRIVVAFQPHRYSRTRDLLADFATSFNEADRLLVTEIYAASEDPIPGVTGEAFAGAVRSHGHRDVDFAKRSGLASTLRGAVREGDLVITLGAGDISQVSTELLELLGQ